MPAPNTPDKDARHLYIQRSRFMARILYEEGACHDFVRQDVRRHAPPRESFQSNTLAIEANAHKQELEIDSGLQFFQR